MNCFNSSSPINIDINDIAGKCDSKCNFTFNYQDSSCIVTNKGEYIQLSYDSSKTPPVIYNNSNYTVKEVRIYFPSLHKYNGTSADGEMIIVHNSTSKPNGLLVCMPIKFVVGNAGITDPNQMQGSMFLHEISKTIANNAPNFGEKTNVSLPSNIRYNLNNYVPKKPFFSYSSNEPFEPCAGINDFVVFNMNEWFVMMWDKSYLNVEKVIKNHSIDVVTDGASLFYNPKGPAPISDQIYIDCQPVGQSDEFVMVQNDSGSSEAVKPRNKPTFEKIFKNPFIGIILGLLLTFVVIYVLNMIFKYTTGKEVVSMGNGYLSSQS